MRSDIGFATKLNFAVRIEVELAARSRCRWLPSRYIGQPQEQVTYGPVSTGRRSPVQDGNRLATVCE